MATRRKAADIRGAHRLVAYASNSHRGYGYERVARPVTVHGDESSGLGRATADTELLLRRATFARPSRRLSPVAAATSGGTRRDQAPSTERPPRAHVRARRKPTCGRPLRRDLGIRRPWRRRGDA